MNRLNPVMIQEELLIDRCYIALAEGMNKRDLDKLLVDLELYTQQKELEKVAVSKVINPQNN